MGYSPVELPTGMLPTLPGQTTADMYHRFHSGNIGMYSVQRQDALWREIRMTIRARHPLPSVSWRPAQPEHHGSGTSYRHAQPHARSSHAAWHARRRASIQWLTFPPRRRSQG